MKLLSLYQSIKRKKQMKAIKPFVKLSESSYYDNGFHVDLQNPKIGTEYLSIGDNSVISGNFVFETEKGHISIGNRCHIGGSTLISRESIFIGDDVTIAWNCTIYDHNSHSVNWNERKLDTLKEYSDIMKYGDPIRNKDWSCVKSKPIVIEDKVWIGLGVTILKGVTIGEGAIIAADSVVTKDIPPWTVASGNPAVILKRLSPDEGVENEGCSFSNL